MGPKKLGEILVEKNFITKDQLNEALELQKKSKEFLGVILINKKFIKEEQLMKALSEQFNIPFVKLEDEVIDWDVCLKYAYTISPEKKALPIYQDEKTVIVAVRNPLDRVSLSQLEIVIRPRTIRLVLVSESEISDFIKEVHRRSRSSLKDLLGTE